ncbi:hypothetical protein GOP47_0027706 [Adiantum capillus-veneris]|nr:hypothetical protein GOP47_0027706 [Adiantum capillus-veneris]
MEALQNAAVARCQPLLSYNCSSLIPPAIRGPSSFTPISSSAPLFQQSTFNALKLPNKNAIAAADATSSAGHSHRTRSLILMRNNAAAGYAAALVEIGQSKRILNLIHADLKKLAAFLQHKQLHGFLLNPSIQNVHKKKILTRLAAEAAFLPYTLKVLNLMVDKKRAALLKDMVKEFEVIYRKIATTEVSVILSATQLRPRQLASIAKYIPAGSMMSDAVDPPFHLMGYVINYGKDTSTAAV